jgi:hypothetical protein
MSSELLNTPAYIELRESEQGQALIKQSKASAANFLFGLESGEMNSEAAKDLTANDIYDAVITSSSLSIEVNGKHYSIEPYYSFIGEETALEMLSDLQSTIEYSLLAANIETKHEEHEAEAQFAALLDKETDVEGSVKPLPQSMLDRVNALRTQAETQRQEHDLIERQTQAILDVCMPDIIGDYDVPDNIPEWKWIEEKACYSHNLNGQDGIWEFIVNLAYGIENVPEKLAPVIAAANRDGVNYILFHQGT